METCYIEVGGAVRDRIRGVPNKDIDYAVEADSFLVMYADIVQRGFTVFLSRPEHGLVRARFPQDHPQYGNVTADFVWCQRDGIPVSVIENLGERDFRMNAIGFYDGHYIDPHNGIADIKNGVINFVHSAADRLQEDPVRAIRLLRFTVTLGFIATDDAWKAIQRYPVASALMRVAVERKREELYKAFKHDTLYTFGLLQELDPYTRRAMLTGIDLIPTIK